MHLLITRPSYTCTRSIYAMLTTKHPVVCLLLLERAGMQCTAEFWQLLMSVCRNNGCVRSLMTHNTWLCIFSGGGSIDNSYMLAYHYLLWAWAIVLYGISLVVSVTDGRVAWHWQPVHIRVHSTATPCEHCSADSWPKNNQHRRWCNWQASGHLALSPAATRGQAEWLK